MRINQVWAALLIAAVFPWSATADEFVNATGSATIGDLQQVQSETVMFDAKFKRAEAKAKLRSELAKTGDDQRADSSVGSPVETSVIINELPTVIGISGAAGRLLATLRYPNGTTVSCKSGDQIPGGYHVAQVGIDTVMLVRGDRRIPLQFGVASMPIQPTRNGSAGSASALPGVSMNSLTPVP